ncbi:hypothetical protein KIPB_000334 [Kipferlia bialata]|uniref:Uncharacterized protein n=1 Tax=Kipferlia bialata TaxID=797122 RepID=A0A9K3GEA6_9EUKA|nr:hypothetical protein KIPB_000334 [Kipferlia bialata]|eukprot:g334.t1
MEEREGGERDSEEGQLPLSEDKQIDETERERLEDTGVGERESMHVLGIGEGTLGDGEAVVEGEGDTYTVETSKTLLLSAFLQSWPPEDIPDDLICYTADRDAVDAWITKRQRVKETERLVAKSGGRVGVELLAHDFDTFMELYEEAPDEWESNLDKSTAELYRDMEALYQLPASEAEITVRERVQKYLKMEFGSGVKRVESVESVGGGLSVDSEWQQLKTQLNLDGLADISVMVVLIKFRDWDPRASLTNAMRLTQEEVREALAGSTRHMTPVERINAKVAEKCGLDTYPDMQPRVGAEHLVTDFQSFISRDLSDQVCVITPKEFAILSTTSLLMGMQERYSLSGSGAQDAVASVLGLIKSYIEGKEAGREDTSDTEGHGEDSYGHNVAEDEILSDPVAEAGSCGSEQQEEESDYGRSIEEVARDRAMAELMAAYARTDRGFAEIFMGREDGDEGGFEVDADQVEERDGARGSDGMDLLTEATHISSEVYGYHFPTLPALISHVNDIVTDVSGFVWEPSDCGVLSCIHPGCHCYIRYTVDTDGFCLVRPTNTPTHSPTPLGGHSAACHACGECFRRSDFVYYTMKTSTEADRVFSNSGAVVSCPLPDGRVFALFLTHSVQECGIISVTDLEAVSNGTPINQLLVSESVSVPKGMRKEVRCTYAAGRVFVYGCEAEESPEDKAMDDELDTVSAPRYSDMSPNRNRLWVYDIGLTRWEEPTPMVVDQKESLWPPAYCDRQLSLVPYQDRVWVIGQEADDFYTGETTKIWSLDPDTYQWREEKDVVPPNFRCQTVCVSNDTLHIWGKVERKNDVSDTVEEQEVTYLTYSPVSGLVRHDNTGPFGWFGPSRMIAVGEYLVGSHELDHFRDSPDGPSVFDTVQGVWVQDMVLRRDPYLCPRPIFNINPLGHLYILEDSDRIVRLNPSLCYPGREGGPYSWALPKTPIRKNAGQEDHY